MVNVQIKCFAKKMLPKNNVMRSTASEDKYAFCELNKRAQEGIVSRISPSRKKKPC